MFRENKITLFIALYYLSITFANQATITDDHTTTSKS